MLFISGQIPQTREGHVPDGAEERLPGADAEVEAASSRGVDVDVTYRDGSTGTSRLTI